MSEAQNIGPAIAAGSGNVRAAIARAAEKTGMDFQYLLAQAKLESSLDPSAKAPTSSAAGLYQFTRSTWLEILDRHGEAHGLDWAGGAIANGRISDPAMASRIMGLRYDADASAAMAAEMARDNREALTGVLGRTPDAAELYLGHFLGSAGAIKFLAVLSTTPDASAANVLPSAAAANRTIFFERSGAPRSVAGVMDLIRDKVDGAMEEGRAAWAVYDPPTVATPAAGFAQAAPVRAFAAARAQFVDSGRQSMAETLQQTFSGGASGAVSTVPDHVRAAYDRLRRFGL